LRHSPIRRVLFFCRTFYLDDSNGAAVAHRALAAALARWGFVIEALCGTTFDTVARGDPAEHLAARGIPLEYAGGDTWDVGPGGITAADPAHLRTAIDGVALTVQRRPTRRLAPPDPFEAAELLALFESTCGRFRPDVLVTYGGDPLTQEVLARGRRAGIATIFALHNFLYTDRSPFAHADAVVVPSQFAADEYARSIGLRCTPLPYVVDPARVRAEDQEPYFLTFVNPCPDKGLFPFVRIADELGRRRPDIPILVVESRGTEADLLACGLDLRRHRTIHLMPRTPDPRDFWRVTRVCLMPSVFRETSGLVAIEAMLNGIPVVASDRGALTETLGRAGLLLPLPAHLTPASRHLPTADEVAPWVDAILRLWDDASFADEHRRRALAESRRWAPEVLKPRYARFLAGLRAGSGPQTAVHDEAGAGP
jgi:glycosyltransferase involved in cell wall biosynthesis